MAGLGDLASWLFGIDPISDANVKQQEQLLQQQSAGYAQRESGDYARQLQYGQALQQQINGTGTPSPAQRQLVAGVDQIGRQAQSMQAGATGSNAALAGYGAMLQQGQLGSQLNQQQAILSAQERAQAQAMYGQNLQSMGARSLSGYGTALGGAASYANMATQIAEQNQRSKAAAAGTLLSTAGTLGASLLSPPGAAGMAASGVAGAGAGYAAAQPGYGASLSAGPAGNGYVMSDPMTGYSQAQPGYDASLNANDMPKDPYQASSAGYGAGLYPYSPSNSVGQR